MSIINKISKSEIPVAIWTIKDVLIVTSCSLLSGIVFYILILILFDDNKVTFRLARYVMSLITIFFPLFWVKRKYKLSKEVLGLKKGNLSLLSHVFIGALTAITYSLLIQLTPLKYRIQLTLTDLKIADSYVYLILLPFSISGFATLILAPVSEEIMDRGFIYSYFRRKLGVIPGLFLQALLFSLLHFNYIYGNTFNLISNRLMIGLILGILYERTGSLYPSMICHGMFNYLAIIFQVFHI
jgi:membrane protease YdiL (CAAX protease family)